MEHFWTTSEQILVHFGTTVEYSMEHIWSTFGVLLDYLESSWSAFGPVWTTYNKLICIKLFRVHIRYKGSQG